MSNNEEKQEKRKLIIHNGTDSWNIKVYTGIPVSDLRETISQVTDINKFVCLDEEGDILCLSSKLPNNTHIYIQKVEINTKKRSINEINPINPISKRIKLTNETSNNKIVKLYWVFDPNGSEPRYASIIGNKVKISVNSGKPFDGGHCQVLTQPKLKLGNKYAFTTTAPDLWHYTQPKFEFDTQPTIGHFCGIAEKHQFYKTLPKNSLVKLTFIIDYSNNIRSLWIFGGNVKDSCIMKITNLPQNGFNLPYWFKSTETDELIVNTLDYNETIEQFNLKSVENGKIYRCKN